MMFLWTLIENMSETHNYISLFHLSYAFDSSTINLSIGCISNNDRAKLLINYTLGMHKDAAPEDV